MRRRATCPQTQWFETGPRGEEITATPQPGFGHNPALIPWQPDLDRYDYDLARWYVQSTLKGPAFARTVQRIEAGAAELTQRLAHVPTRAEQIAAEAEWVFGEAYAVAVLDDATRTLFGVQTQTVLLSDSTLFKQAFSRTGQDFALSDYWQVQRVIEQAQVIVRDNRVPESCAFIRVGNEWWQAVIKKTEDQRELYLTSFRRTNRAALNAAMRNGTVLRDAR